MSEKVEVRGDVAQLIGGNVNEAPRLNNVVNFNVGSDNVPTQMLTDLQRRRIGSMVKDLCSITREKNLDVYREILTDFGAERMSEMPRDQYHDIIATVGRWIDEAKGNAVKLSATITEQKTVESPSATGLEHTLLKTCSVCEEKERTFERLQRQCRVQWFLLISLALGCGFLLFRWPSSADSTTNQCYFDSKPYSIGSTLRFANGLYKECTFVSPTDSASWTKAR